MNIQFEGKIKMEKLIGTLALFKLLQFLTQEKGFTIAKIKSDEIKLTKSILPAAGDEHSGDDMEIEVEIEVSKGKTEIEVECAKLEYVKDMVSEIAAIID